MVNLISPAADTCISGVVEITVEASDPESGIDWVKFEMGKIVDGQIIDRKSVV